MAEFLELIGPDAIRNLLQNWPFAALVIAGVIAVWRQFIQCIKDRESDLHELREENAALLDRLLNRND